MVAVLALASRASMAPLVMEGMVVYPKLWFPRRHAQPRQSNSQHAGAVFTTSCCNPPCLCSNEGYQTSFMSGTFLAENSSYYFSVLEILLGKLSKHLFDQSLKRIANFVNANILPGATSEVGLLCCACVHSYLVSYYRIDQYKSFICGTSEARRCRADGSRQCSCENLLTCGSSLCSRCGTSKKCAHHIKMRGRRKWSPYSS
ncbi:uncharacterized protein LOC120711437 isoform X2 [Panicum virgatum]|uniref:uncharacterized protein LOC120711437 isoform X2 n=1 Tax=Panicum virgatum TaxID=38727 RepID=UPI0019D52596|nr:uncharacterized protein LOC120711437 isoform X2 [Panicum virgatum]